MAIPNSKRLIAGILLLLFWTALSATQTVPLSTEGWASLVPLRCPLSWIFDIQCPTCGLGRSLVAAAHGHIQESFRYHPFGWLIFWGSQGLLICWMIWPRGWESVRRFWSKIVLSRPLLWALIILYSLWGFCWRTQI